MNLFRTLLVLTACIAASSAAMAADHDLKSQFLNPPDDAKPMMRWWWFGPSVTKAELEREMRVMKQGGFGGFEVQPVYPLALDQPEKGIKNLPFLSDEFLEALRFTSEMAPKLGLRMDLTLGSGWPYGGPQIPVEHAASRLRPDKVRYAAGAESVALSALRPGESFIAAFDSETNLELTDVHDGQVHFSKPAAKAGEVWVAIAGRTGQTVKRSAAGAEGFVLDHYDPKAIELYLSAVGDRLLKPLAANKPYAIFCDSLEAYGSDWTGDLLQEFRARRGYDLRPWLPALAGDMGPKTAAVRYDWGRTLTELFQDRFLKRMQQWSHSNGVKFRIQNYGIPPAVISSAAYADLPEGEGAQWKIVRASRWASSASHLFGRPVTSSETWTWLHSPVFRATPLDVKAEADLHFIEGITQLIGHGWPYTPESVEYPGWRFYASAALDEKNPWWIVMPDVTRYLQRISFLLRQGQPANDVALYLPNSDAWAQFSAGKVHMIEVLRDLVGSEVIEQILASGYGFDFFDDGTVDQVIQSKRYKIVVLPGVQTMPAETARKLAGFADAGGVVIATRQKPSRAPGLMATEAEHAVVRALAVKLVSDEQQIGGSLRSALTPDLAFSPATPEIAFIHRKTPEGEVYFVVNTSNVRRRATASFRVSGLKPEIWNAFTGESTGVAVLEGKAGATSLDLELEPYESRVIVFSRSAAEPLKNVSLAASGAVVDLSSGWTVRFGKAGSAVAFDRLHSWTDDERTRFYSGVATYERDVEISSDWARANVMLDFGEGSAVVQPTTGNAGNPGIRAWLEGPIREAAVVYVNEKRAGPVWCPPYRIKVGQLLRPGKNRIRIEVANLALNYMSGHPLPDYRELRARYGNRFDPQDMDKVKAMESGILGPVRLIP